MSSGQRPGNSPGEWSLPRIAPLLATRTLSPLTEAAGGFTSRFLGRRQEPKERYSDNSNLSLRPGTLGTESRGSGLRGVLARLEEPGVNRSSSGSSHGSGGSGGSSGYHSLAHREAERECVREELSGSCVEFEDSEEEAGATVVTGGLRLPEAAGAPVADTGRRMPADGLSSSISTFLRKTDHFTEDYKQAVREREMSTNRDLSGIDKAGGSYDLRAASVARASSVSRQFDSPSAAFVRGGSVSRGFEMATSRDPFYSAISGNAVASRSYGYREASVPADRGSRLLSPLREGGRILSPGSSALETLSPQSSRGAGRAQNFSSLEDECNWILSTAQAGPVQPGGNGLEQLAEEDGGDEDENTLDDISGDELSEMTEDLNSPSLQPDSSGEPCQAPRPRRKERKKAAPLTEEQLKSRSAGRRTLNTDRLELDLLSTRLGANGLTNTIDPMDSMDSDGMYRARCERALQEVEVVKRQLLEQHEEDLEQTIMVKKQLEKKLNEAYEDADEQKRDAANWKRKSQKAQGEIGETRVLLEEQNEKNELLERKFRKVDAELIEIQQEIYREAEVRARLERDMEAVKREKKQLQEEHHAMKLDIEYKEDKLTSLGREVAELETRGAAEDEVARLKKQRQDLEARLREQEEELDDLAGQVQQLEAGKIKLEADLTLVKKEHRRETQGKDDELEDTRAAAGKKVKVLEQQLEQEHEERIGFLRERHDLEGKVITLQDMLERSGDEELVAKLKKDLKRTKALLKDAQLMVEKSQSEGTNKVIMRQLKNQLEDAEFARTGAMKAKQNAELELADVQVQLEDVSRGKADLDEKNLRLGRERADLASHLQETEEELQDVMRKYKASVSAVTTDQITIQDQAASIQSLEAERNKLREQCAEITQRLDHMEGENVSTAQHKRLELKIRELESKLELERTTRQRVETQIQRQKEGGEKSVKEVEELRVKEAAGQEEAKKLARVARELKEELATVRGKEAEGLHRKGDLEKQLEVSEAETLAVRTELKTALKRVEDLQAAMQGELDSDNSDGDSDSSDEEMSVFLDHHRRAMSVQRERESQMRDIRASVGREVRSLSREPVTRDLRSMTRDVRASVAREFESATRDLPGVQLRPAEEANTIIPFNPIAEED